MGSLIPSEQQNPSSSTSDIAMRLPVLRDQILHNFLGGGDSVQKKAAIQGNAHGGHDLTIPGTDGNTYHASRYGNPNSPNVVLSLHGLYPFREGFHKQYTDHASLEHAQHRVVDMLPHLPGNMPSFSKYTLENYMEVSMTYLAGFIMWLRDYTRVENILLEGVSKGGYDALWYSALFPEQVRKLCLISPLGLEGEIKPGQQSDNKEQKTTIIENNQEELCRQAANFLGLRDENLDESSKLIVARDMGIAIEHVRSITRLRHALRHIEKDTTHALITALSASAYKIPVFLAASEDDKLTKRPGMLEYAQALELSPQQFFTCTDGGHALHMATSTSKDFTTRRRQHLISN